MARRRRRPRRPPQVEPDLTVPGHPDIFAIGDTVTIDGPDGKPVPGIAPAAKQQGRTSPRRSRRGCAATRGSPFRYQHAGDLAQIGKRAAVIDFGWIKLRGTLAWWIWGFAHIYFLIGLRNRLASRSPGSGSTPATSAAPG